MSAAEVAGKSDVMLLKRLRAEIDVAAEKGEYSITHYGHMPKYVRDALVQDGFKLREYTGCVISWESEEQ